MQVSEIALGTWAIGGSGWGDTSRVESISAIHEMIEHGVNFIDTAIVYNNGVSEKIVGEAIQGRRKDVYLATKGGIYNNGHHVVKDGTKENILSQCDESLKNLGTDYIDLYFVHWPDSNTLFSETFDAMHQLQKAGKIRYIGVSNFTLEQIYDAEKYVEIAAFQPPYSMVERDQERLIQWVHDHNIGIMTYGSLGAGILTGAYRALPKFDLSDMRYVFYDYFREPKFTKTMELLKTLDKIAEKRQVPISQIAINWNVQKEFVDTSILGVRTTRHAKENCMAMNWQLAAEEMAEIDAAIENSF